MIRPPEVEVYPFTDFEQIIAKCKEEYLNPALNEDTDTFILFDYDKLLVRDGKASAARFPFRRIIPKIDDKTVEHLQDLYSASEGKVAIVTNRDSEVTFPWNSNEIMASLKWQLEESGLGKMRIFENMNRFVQLKRVADRIVPGNRERYEKLADWMYEHRAGSDRKRMRVVMISDVDILGMSFTERPFLHRLTREFQRLSYVEDLQLVNLVLTSSSRIGKVRDKLFIDIGRKF
jgi:hypothetical protein